MTLDDLQRLAAALDEHQVDYAVIGGAAMNAHGFIRATEDIDIMVAATEENVRALRDALRAVWADPAVDEITARDLAGDYPAIRYGPPGGSIYVDIIARFGTAMAFDDLELVTIAVGDTPVRVASPRSLYRMKRGTVRPIDHADALALKRRFALEED